jgi:hypothetical protein
MDETSLERSPRANDFVHRAEGLEHSQCFLRQEPGPRGAMSENRSYVIYAWVGKIAWARRPLPGGLTGG